MSELIIIILVEIQYQHISYVHTSGFFCANQMEEVKDVGSQALQNVVMLANIISLTLEADGDKSTNFSQSGESISE